VNLINGRELISKDGNCTNGRAISKWHLVASDSALPGGNSTKQLVTCSNRAGSPYPYQIIRSNCSTLQEKISIFEEQALLMLPPLHLQWQIATRTLQSFWRRAQQKN
jgi:hypothetical protein